MSNVEDKRESEETPESDSLGTCGCVDYHMADCPLRTGSRDYYHEWRDDFELEYYSEGGY